MGREQLFNAGFLISVVIVAVALLVGASGAFAQWENPPDPVKINGVQADAPGDDSENLNEEFIALQLEGSVEEMSLITLEGYTVSYGDSGQEYTFDRGFGPGSTIILHTGTGEDTLKPGQAVHDRYANLSEPVLDNDGDVITIRDTEGNIVDQVSYGDQSSSDGTTEEPSSPTMTLSTTMTDNIDGGTTTITTTEQDSEGDSTDGGNGKAKMN
ncbi:hypothetical protein BRC90_07980 [Halobacteriales archaeon QS_4_69_34]|nr:MAG: hypothetical protein BRC90_07980 [Halobacteriales archaeon QS_4_69_34]